MTKKDIERELARMNARMMHWEQVDQAASRSHDLARAMIAAILKQRDVLNVGIAEFNE